MREPLAGEISEGEEPQRGSQEGRAGLMAGGIFSRGCSPRRTVAALPRATKGSHQPIKKLDPGQWARGGVGLGGVSMN